MKGNITICIIGIALTMHAQVRHPEHDWTAQLKVVDETGKPVTGAHVKIYYGQTNEISGLSDQDGIFSATHHDTVENLAFEANKSGYYPFMERYHLGRNYKPENWNIAQDVVLKRVIRKIPMYAKSVNSHVPAVDKAVGYDLIAGDWVAPYGKGVSGDILFTAHFDKSNPNISRFKLTVSFSNKMDGIQEFEVPQYYLDSHGSALRSAQVAPDSGYQPEWIQTDDREAGQPPKTNRDSNRNYYFRIRTVLNEQGNIKSALYGKIYGDFMRFSYYLNPTANSRDVEFDTEQNLIRNLGELEEVKAP